MKLDASESVDGNIVLEGRKKRRAKDIGEGLKDAAVRACVRKDDDTVATNRICVVCFSPLFNFDLVLCY